MKGLAMIRCFVVTVMVMMALCGACLLPGVSLGVDVAMAAEKVEAVSPAVSPLSGMVGEVLTEILTLVGIFLAGLLTIYLKKGMVLLNIRQSMETDTMIAHAAHRAVTYVEEKARDAVKQSLPSNLSTGVGKLDEAVAHMTRAGIEVAREEAEDYIHSAIARAKGTGASKEAVD